MIIGITGTLGAGKGKIVDFLKEKGFEHYSVREYLTQEIKKRELPLNRDSMVSIANELREKNSPSFIAEELYKQAKKIKKNCIIESIRTIGEVEALKSKGDFYLIAVDALPETRYERTLLRQSETDKISYQKFLEDEKRERTSNEKHKQNLEACMERADILILNNNGVGELQQKVEKIYEKISSENTKPSWDEYFIKMASLVAERSTCLRHHVGAVIVKDKRVLTTGYNGAARGKKDCLELGCNKDKLSLASGMGYEECRAIHAEQNAIIQSGLHGIVIKDSSLYLTHTPCRMCAKEIVQVGINEIITYQDFEGDNGAKKYLLDSGIKIKKIPRPNNKISFKD